MMIGSTPEARRKALFAVSVTSPRAAASVFTWEALSSTISRSTATVDIFSLIMVAFSFIIFLISESSFVVASTVLSSS
jgi:hypothetical protein